MLGALSRTLSCQEEVFVQANQLLGQLHPRHLLLLACLGLGELRQSFHDRAVQLDPLPFLQSHRGRPQIRSFPETSTFRGIRGVRSCGERRKLSQGHGTITEESQISIAQHGINFTFGPSLSMSCICNDDHFVVQVHVVYPVHLERTTFQASFILQSRYEIVSQLQCILSRAKILATCPTVIILASAADVTMYTIVGPCGESVGQQIPHDVIRFCDGCCAVGYFLLLSLVQCHTLVLVQGLEKDREPTMHIFAHETSRLRQQNCVVLCKRIWMNNV